MEEIPLFGLWWIFPFVALGYYLLDSLLRWRLVPWLRESKYYQPDKEQTKDVLPGHTVALMTERIPVTAVAISVIGVIIVYQTSNDVIKARSPLVLPSAYIFSWNFIQDFYRMFQTFKLSSTKHSSLSNFSVARKMVYTQFSIVLHHISLCTFGLIVAHYLVRKGYGDFIFGCIYCFEFSNIFINGYFILKELKLTKTLMYVVNGVLLISSFFVTRIAMFPFMYWISICISVSQWRYHICCIWYESCLPHFSFSCFFISILLVRKDSHNDNA